MIDLNEIKMDLQPNNPHHGRLMKNDLVIILKFPNSGTCNPFFSRSNISNETFRNCPDFDLKISD